MKTSDNNLIEKYLDGTASPEELAVFDGRLRANPALRLEFLKESGFECQLRFLLKTSPAVAPESTAAVDVIDVADLPRATTIYWRPSWLWIPVAAAAAAAAGHFAWWPYSHQELAHINGWTAFYVGAAMSAWV